MARLDKLRQEKLEPERISTAIRKLTELGKEIIYRDSTKIMFDHIGHQVTFYPYSGWHSGKSIKDGRGLENLLKQIR